MEPTCRKSKRQQIEELCATVKKLEARIADLEKRPYICVPPEKKASPWGNIVFDWGKPC